MVVLTDKIRTPRHESMGRPRLIRRLTTPRRPKLILLTAPAGSGKTTLLGEFAAVTDEPVAWLRLDSADGELDRLLAHFDAALEAAVGDRYRVVDESIDGRVSALQEIGAITIILDDVHTVTDSAAEAFVGRLVSCCPSAVRLVVASRTLPAVDDVGLRMAGELAEITADDLRFRTWEVETLFARHYGVALRPDELAELHRRTQGWAAGLQLFHLATAGKDEATRRNTLDALATRSRLVRDYLAHNVFSGLPPELREFLLTTSVLGVLTGAMCDELRGASGSDAALTELRRRQIFTRALDDCGTYRYHDVLRAHLLARLVEDVGTDELHRRCLAAGDLLAANGFAAEAIEAYARAGPLGGVDASFVLAESGATLASRVDGWAASLPPSLIADDPWAGLAHARWLLLRGDWRAAIRGYHRAESRFDDASQADRCRAERHVAQRMLQPSEVGRTAASWAETIRAALDGTEPPPAPPIPTPLDSLATAVSALLSGRVAGAIDHAEQASETTSGVVRAAATIVSRLAPAWAPGSAVLVGADLDAGDLETTGGPWLARLAAHVQPLLDGTTEPPVVEGTDDPWSGAVCAHLSGNATIERDPRAAVAHYRRAEGCAGEAVAPVLACWARSGIAAATLRTGDLREAERLARDVEAEARRHNVPGARAVASGVLALCGTTGGDAHAAVAKQLSTELGLSIPLAPVPVPTGVEVRVLGGLAVTVDGRPVDVDALKPRWRSLLAVLALEPGRVVHRDVLVDRLWPDAEPDKGRHLLQVAVSAVRRTLEPDRQRTDPTVVARVGDCYELVVDDLDNHDLHRLATALTGSPAEIVAAAERFTAPVPEEAGNDWAVDAAAETSRRVVDALSRVVRTTDDPALIERATTAGLRIDPYRDDLWRARIATLETQGEIGAANRADEAYRRRLAELGITPD